LPKNIYHTKKIFGIGLKISSSKEKLNRLKEKVVLLHGAKILFKLKINGKSFLRDT